MVENVLTKDRITLNPFLKKSKNSKKFFNKINNISFLNKIDRKIKNRKIEKNQIWKIDIKKNYFLNQYMGLKKEIKLQILKQI